MPRTPPTKRRAAARALFDRLATPRQRRLLARATTAEDERWAYSALDDRLSRAHYEVEELQHAVRRASDAARALVRALPSGLLAPETLPALVTGLTDLRQFTRDLAVTTADARNLTSAQVRDLDRATRHDTRFTTMRGADRGAAGARASTGSGTTVRRSTATGTKTPRATTKRATTPVTKKAEKKVGTQVATAPTKRSARGAATRPTKGAAARAAKGARAGGPTPGGKTPPRKASARKVLAGKTTARNAATTRSGTAVPAREATVVGSRTRGQTAAPAPSVGTGTSTTPRNPTARNATPRKTTARTIPPRAPQAPGAGPATTASVARPETTRQPDATTAPAIAAAPTTAVPRLATLVDLATNDPIVTYGVAVRRPRGRLTEHVVTAVWGATERGYGGPRAPEVTQPAWFLHAAPGRYTAADRVTHRHSLQELEACWRGDRHDDV